MNRGLAVLCFLLACSAHAYPPSLTGRIVRALDSPYALGEGRPRVSLLAEYEQVKAQRPGLLKPVGMIIGGVLGMGLGVGSGVLGVAFAIFGGATEGATFFILGIVLAAVGIGFVVAGIVAVLATSRERSGADLRLRDLEEQLKRSGEESVIERKPMIQLASF